MESEKLQKFLQEVILNRSFIVNNHRFLINKIYIRRCYEYAKVWIISEFQDIPIRHWDKIYLDLTTSDEISYDLENIASLENRFQEIFEKYFSLSNIVVAISELNNITCLIFDL